MLLTKINVVKKKCFFFFLKKAEVADKQIQVFAQEQVICCAHLPHRAFSVLSALLPMQPMFSGTRPILIRPVKFIGAYAAVGKLHAVLSARTFAF